MSDFWHYLFFMIAYTYAFPTQGPIIAVIPPGSNVSVAFEQGGKPPSILTNVKNTGFMQPMDNMFHRVEFHFLDFQMNQTSPFATNLVQQLEIYVNSSFGMHPRQQTGTELTEGDASSFAGEIPDTVEGFTQLYTGTYNGGGENKVNIDRTITSDMCGMMFDKGYMEIWVRPINAAVSGAFREGFYYCFYNMNMGDTMVQEPDAQWSGIFQCNSGSLNNYSHRLWYKMRYYNIESKSCNMGNMKVF